MPSHTLLESAALVPAYALVVFLSYFQMRYNPLAKGPRALIMLASGTLLLRGASLVVWDPSLAGLLYQASRVAILVTGLSLGCLIILWRIDNQVNGK